MIIFEDYDIKIIVRDNSYFMKYDAGAAVSQYVEIEITKEEAERAQLGCKYADEIIWYYKNKKRGLV